MTPGEQSELLEHLLLCICLRLNVAHCIIFTFIISLTLIHISILTFTITLTLVLVIVLFFLTMTFFMLMSSYWIAGENKPVEAMNLQIVSCPKSSELCTCSNMIAKSLH